MTPERSPFFTLLSWMRTCQPEPAPPPAEDVEAIFMTIERELGLELPGDLKTYFRLLNSDLTQREHALFYGLIAIPLQFGDGERKDLSHLDSVFMDPNFQTIEAVDPPGTVRTVPFDAGWLPLAHDYGGAYIAVDLHPDERGQVGQIINFGAQERKRFVLASSITEFSTEMLQNIADGRVEQACEGEAVELRFTNSEITHVLDLYEQFGASVLKPTPPLGRASPL